MRYCQSFSLAAILMLVVLGLFQLVGTGLAGSAAFLRVQAGTQAPAVGSGYHLLKKIPLGGEGGWDYLALDAAARRLYIARATRVMVLDADAGKAVGEIPDTPGVHGVALAPEFGRGFTSNGRGASVAGTVPLGGRPEFAAASGSGQVYVNLEDKSELLAIDSQKLSVTHRWPLKPCEEPSGLAIDTRHQRLFVGCHNQMMAVVDAATGRVVTTLPIGRGVDANTFDAGTQLAFSSNGDGTLTVVHEETPDKFSVVENVTTQRGARTMALDAQTHNIFLVTAEFAPPPAPTPENPRPRPPIVPGSFVLLIFGR